MNKQQETEAKERFTEWAFKEANDYGKGRMTIALEAWLKQEEEIIRLKKIIVKLEKEIERIL